MRRLSDKQDHVHGEEIVTSESPDSISGFEEIPSTAQPGAAEGIQDIIDDQDKEAEEFAIKFLTTVLRLRGVRIERDQFLKTELHKRGIAPAQITHAIDDSPAAAGITPLLLDEIAQASIEFERNKSSTLSFAAGVPGGFAMLATVPGDITQFYVHVFRIMQKLAYLYGWQSFLEDTENVDDETLGKLTGFLGVMMGIAGATGSIRHFAIRVARPAVEKKIANVALTKTAWYLPMKQTLRLVGVQVTKQSLARTVTKVIPLVGGVVSGGFTYIAFNTQSKRLMGYLRELPPPNVDAAEYLAAVKRAEDASKTEQDHSEEIKNDKTSAGSTVKRLTQGVAPTFRNARSSLTNRVGALRRTHDDEATQLPDTDNG